MSHGAPHTTPLPQAPKPPPPPRPVPADFRYVLSFLIPMGVGFTLMAAMFLAIYFAVPMLRDAMPIEAQLGMGLAMLVGPICLYFGLRARRRIQKLYRDGHVAMGQVAGWQRASSRSTNAARFNKHIRVMFAANGHQWEGLFNLSGAFSPPPNGTAFWVIYDPSDPSRNIVVGQETV